MKLRNLLLSAAACFFSVAVATAQDAAKTDPAHYKVEFENSQVRVLRVHYGPHEKSIMHSHPDAVAVYLTDGSMRFNLPGGKSMDVTGKKGEALFTPAVVHMPEDTGDSPFDAIVIELKGNKAGTPAKRIAKK